MSPKRVVFDKPIVRADTEKMKFPRICPVCGASAEDIMPLTVIPNQYKSLRPSMDYMPSYYGRQQNNSIAPIKKTLYIPVCENHYLTDEGAGQYKSYCIVFDGLALAYLILALLTFGNQLWSAGRLSPWLFFAVGIFGTFLSITYVLFRPGPVENSVKIIGFDGGFRHIWLQFKESNYRDEFMKENVMTAELVKWIQRA
ncbi:MAG: hypothetical protein ACFFEA_02115 [Candidatus Thorarchaeota archaeon]